MNFITYVALAAIAAWIAALVWGALSKPKKYPLTYRALGEEESYWDAQDTAARDEYERAMKEGMNTQPAVYDEVAITGEQSHGTRKTA